MRNFVCVDLGSSGTRYATSAAVANEEDIREISNEHVYVNRDDIIDVEGASRDVRDNLDVIIEKLGTDGYRRRLLLGTMANKCDRIVSTPILDRMKIKQDISYDSLVLACALAKVEDDMGDAPISLFMSLPPAEVQCAKGNIGNSDGATAKIVGDYRVTFLKMGNKVVDLSITDVNYSDEPFMALTSFFMTTDGVYKPNTEEYKEGIVLSLDIGNSTSDLACTENGVYLERASETINVGCNIIRSVVKNKYREQFGSPVKSDNTLNQIVREGRAKVGGQWKDLSSMVSAGKQKLAAEIVSEILGGYYTNVGIAPTEVIAIVVSGGGSMASSYRDNDGNPKITSKPVCDYVCTEVQKCSADVPVVSVGGNPRTAVARGLVAKAYIMCKDKE